MIRKDKSYNTWYAQIDTKDPVTGKRKTRKKRGFRTKSEAKQAEVDMMRETSTTLVTFHAMSDQYVNSLDSRQVSKEVLKSVYKHHCTDLYEMDFSTIGKPELLKWYTDLKDSDLAFRTKNRIITSVKAVFRFAARIYDLRDPSVILRPIKATSDDDEPMHVWTIDQFNKFISKVPEGYYRAFFITLFWTGMRRGECMALQCSDLTNDGCLDVNKSIKHYQNGFTPLKNRGSRRKIKLDDRTLTVVKECAQASRNGFIFGGERSLPISEIQDTFVKAVKASGVPKIRIHDLRHSHATILINEGVNIMAVSKRLGHADVSITLRVYAHLMQKTDNQMMEEIEKLHKSG